MAGEGTRGQRQETQALRTGFPDAPHGHAGERASERGGESGSVASAREAGEAQAASSLLLASGAGRGRRHSPCLTTVTRTLEVPLPAEDRAEQRYSALSRMASRSQLSAWALPSGSAWVCVGTHVSSSRPFFSQTKWTSAGPGDTETLSTRWPLGLLRGPPGTGVGTGPPTPGPLLSRLDSQRGMGQLSLRSSRPWRRRVTRGAEVRPQCLRSLRLLGAPRTRLARACLETGLHPGSGPFASHPPTGATPASPGPRLGVGLPLGNRG